MPYGKLYAPEIFVCHSLVLLAVLKTWLGLVAQRTGYQTVEFVLPSPTPVSLQLTGLCIHVLEYDAPICHPWDGRFVNAISKVLKFASAAALLVYIVLANEAAARLDGYS